MADEGYSREEHKGESPFRHIQHPRKRAYLEAVVARSGKKIAACADAGIDQSTPYSRPWKEDEEFQEALRLAEEVAAQKLVDETNRRAHDGMREPQFTKDGDWLRDPDQCDCGHDRKEWHPRIEGKGTAKWTNGPCSAPGCDCPGFVGAPVYKHVYSDTLMKFLLTGLLPDTFGKKVEVNQRLLKMDVSRLPDHLLDRIAAGEPLAAVLASAAASGEGSPGELLGIEGGAKAGGGGAGQTRSASHVEPEVLEAEVVEEDGDPPGEAATDSASHVGTEGEDEPEEGDEGEGVDTDWLDPGDL